MSEHLNQEFERKHNSYTKFYSQIQVLYSFVDFSHLVFDLERHFELSSREHNLVENLKWTVLDLALEFGPSSRGQRELVLVQQLIKVHGKSFSTLPSPLINQSLITELVTRCLEGHSDNYNDVISLK